MAKRAPICPPGVWCLTPTLGFILVVIVLSGLFYFLMNKQQPQQQQPYKEQNVIVPPVNVFSGGDDRYTRAPEPLRMWQTGPDLRGGLIPPGAVPVNVPTRGLPQSYQQMGIIKTGDKILPLYGRQTAYRSDRYNYYTRTDTYNPVQLPVRFEKRDCMDSIGCNELFGGEQVKVSGIESSGPVEIYKFDGPTYIPGLI